jgi:type IV secretory pathway VirB10-like protein
MQPMPSLMPSLLKYFTIVGGVLVLALISINAVLEPGGPGPRLVNAQPKNVAIRHDPRASLVERLRAEEAARAAAAKAEREPQPVTVAVPAAPAPQPVIQAAAPTQPETLAKPEVTAPAALTVAPSEDEAAQAVRQAREKIAAEKARKKRLARAKAKALEEASASRQQDQIYYGYAPRPTYGPFGQAQGWQGGSWAQR